MAANDDERTKTSGPLLPNESTVVAMKAARASELETVTLEQLQAVLDEDGPSEACPGRPRGWSVGACAEFTQMSGGWVYIVTNRPNGVLYTGVTSDLARRAYEHREGLISGFTRRYGLKRLVWLERHDDTAAAIQREKNIKHWSRAWKAQM